MKGSKLVLVAALAGASCTDSNLFVAPEADRAVPRLRLEAEVCAPEPLSQAAPYKVLFVIDTSGSTSETDPPVGGQTRREKAVRAIIDSYMRWINVSYGVITYSDVPRRQTFGFVGTATDADLAVLNGAIANVSNSQGGTNYNDTLWSAIDFIQTDASAIAPAELLITHYQVFWVSDGYPSVGVTDPDAIVAGVDYLDAWLADRAAEFRLDSAFLGEYSMAGPQTGDPRLLLQRMAAAGNGIFTDVSGGAALAFTVEIRNVFRQFHLAGVVANNRNAVFGLPNPFADSDGDGIVDLDEDDLRLDPTNPDTDDDGFTDGVELKLSLGQLDGSVIEGAIADPNPLVPNPGCTLKGIDTDLDGLGDCDEAQLRTDATAADSDGDGLPDSVEVSAGSSPVSRDTTFDFDLDRVSDEDEARSHMLPREYNAPLELERWSYRYLITELPNDGSSPTPCYSIVVANLAVVETLEGEGHPHGANDVDLWAAFASEYDLGPPLFKRATETARYLAELDVLSPASALLEYAADEFKALPLDPRPPVPVP